MGGYIIFHKYFRGYLSKTNPKTALKNWKKKIEKDLLRSSSTPKRRVSKKEVKKKKSDSIVSNFRRHWVCGMNETD